MPNSTKANKAKGRKLQQQVIRMLESSPLLQSTICQDTTSGLLSTPMGMNGPDIIIPPSLQDSLPFSIECKARKNIAIYSYYAQAQKEAEGKNLEPVVVVKADYKKPLVVVDAEYFFGKVLS